MPEETFSPIEALRAHAEAIKDVPPQTTEFGLGTKSLPVSSSDDAPLVTRLQAGPKTAEQLADYRRTYNEPEPSAPSLEDIVQSIVLASQHLTDEEWLLFRSRVGRLMGYLPVLRENDDHE